MSTESFAPQEEFRPESQAELGRFVGENAAGRRLPLYPVGGRTSLNYGHPPSAAGVMVSTSSLDEIIDYPARDMTVTVESGIRMNGLAALLEKENQQLPIDVAQAHRATLGGVAATNTSGPRRFGYGTMRDYVIGISAVDAAGRLFHAGGRVVKNVAGYDLCKLLVGSLGTLAVITQLTLKLRPVPESSTIVWSTFDSPRSIDSVLQSLLTSETRPVVVDVLNAAAARQIAAEARQDLPVEHPVLIVAFEGSERTLTWQVDKLRRELAPAGPKNIEVLGGPAYRGVLAVMAEFQVCCDDPLTFQANLLPSRTMEFLERATRRDVVAQAHAGNGIVVGHLPDSVANAEQAVSLVSPLRDFCRSQRGNLVIFDCPADWKSRLPVFGNAEPSWPLMKRLKDTLDPQNLLSPGRFIDAAMAARKP